MNYVILVSDGFSVVTFRETDEARAKLLYHVAVDSKRFTYVCLTEVVERHIVKQEWSDNGGEIELDYGAED